MFKLLVILYIIKLYAQINIYKPPDTASDYSRSIVLVMKGELVSETINYDTKTMYQFEPKCNLLRSTLQVKQHVSEAVVCRFLKIL